MMEKVPPLMQEIADKFGLRIRFGRFSKPIYMLGGMGDWAVDRAEEEYEQRKEEEIAPAS